MTPNRNVLWSRVLIEAFAAMGVRHVCVSPGSRSAPLVTVAAGESRLAVGVHLDERSAAFFALGIGKSTGRPAVVITTSGTAAANCLPAVIEASLSRIPILLLTADRPPEERESGASQTIDQIRLYGNYVRFFQDLPLPEIDYERLRMLASVAAHAHELSLSPVPGPIHLNVPFREPLAPIIAGEAEVTAAEKRYKDSLAHQAAPLEISRSVRAAAGDDLDRHARRIGAAERPLLVAGPERLGGAIGEGIFHLARAGRIPLFADIGSGLRFRDRPPEGLCRYADAFLRSERIADLSPDLVVRIGGLPTSKSVQNYLVRHRPPLLQIQPDPLRRDPASLASWVWEGQADPICHDLADRIEGRTAADRHWLTTFCDAERMAHEKINACTVPLDGMAVRAAVQSLPTDSCAFFSNSLPIRYAETFASAGPTGLRCFVSRGANGIDGITSTAFGVARGLDLPLLLVTGDLAFLHDLGGLRAARLLKRPAAVLLLNNNGGGIFSHLPIAQFGDLFEPFFATPHDCDLGSAARIFGLEQNRADDPKQVSRLVNQAMQSRGTRIVELRTDRAETMRQHRELMRQVAAAIDEA